MASADGLSCRPIIEGLEHDLGWPVEVIALALDVDRRTVERWRSDRSMPRGRTRTRLTELVALHGQLMRMFGTAETVQAWLRDGGRYLGGFTRVEALRAGRVDRVRADLDGLAAGVYL